VLANTLLAMTAIVAVLTFGDLILSSPQKQKISDCTIRLWNWLDEMKRLSFLRWLESRALQRRLILIASLISVVPLSYLLFDFARGALASVRFETEDLWELIEWAKYIVIGTVFGVWLGPHLVSFLLNGITARQVLRRVAITFLTVAVPIAAFALWLVYDTDGHEVHVYWSLMAMLFVFPIEFAMAVFWLMAFIPLIGVYSLGAGLGLSEFVVRRVAENPKGPILAASAMIAAILAIFKAFGYA